MPVTIPPNYPTGSTDEEIQRTVGELSQEIITGGANINTVLRFVPLINVGQAELQSRVLSSSNQTTAKLHKEVKELKNITEQYSKSSEKFSSASKKLSIAAIILAVLSLAVSITLSMRSDHSSSQWQVKQL